MQGTAEAQKAIQAVRNEAQDPERHEGLHKMWGPVNLPVPAILKDNGHNSKAAADKSESPAHKRVYDQVRKETIEYNPLVIRGSEGDHTRSLADIVP